MIDTALREAFGNMVRNSTVRTIVGTRIRERRRQIGVTQAELARRIGISASYLNLIEKNKRGIAGPLLRKTADALSLRLDELDGATERRLHESLSEIAFLPALRNLGAEAESAGEFIGRYPGWARTLSALARSEQEATEKARTLADRLTHDPFLGEQLHKMLTHVSAIRSAAEILEEFDDIPSDQQRRFHNIILEESNTLSVVGEALTAHFDKVHETDRTLTPLDEVEALFEAHDNHFREIEDAAASLSHFLTDPTLGSRQKRARAVVEETLSPMIRDFVETQPQLETTAARNRAVVSLTEYAQRVALVPMGPLLNRALALKFDLEGLADSFSVGVETICHRLAAMPRRDDLPRIAYLQANAAGTIIEMLGIRDLVVSRYASACPLWVLFRAQQSPEAMIRQRALFPSGARFVFVARARNTGATGFGKPRHYVTDMIAMTEKDAQMTVYGPDPSVPVEEVGAACRICPREACVQRVDDPQTE